MVALGGKFSYYPQIIEKNANTKGSRMQFAPDHWLQAAESGHELKVFGLQSLGYKSTHSINVLDTTSVLTFHFR